MVLDTVASPNSRRNYGKALDGLFALAGGHPLTPALFMEYRASMEALSPRPPMSGSRRCASWSPRRGETAWSGLRRPRGLRRFRTSARREFAWVTG
jgi:hypothetical protein